MRPEKKNPTLSKVLVYARVSSREQAEGYSIDAQLELLRDYAYKQGLTIAKEFVDVETAKKCGRPRFGDMLAYFKAHSSTVHLLVGGPIYSIKSRIPPKSGRWSKFYVRTPLCGME